MNERPAQSSGAPAALLALLILGIFLAAVVSTLFVGRSAQFAMVEAELAGVEAVEAGQEALAQAQAAQEQRAKLRLVSWNIESGGNDPTVIADQLVTDLERYDVYGLTEVNASNTSRYLQSIQEAHGESYESIVTVTGGGDRMMLIYDSDHLQALEHAELEAHDGVRMNDVNFRHRSPLMARFRNRATETEFIVVLNHLARGKAEVRQEQAKGLRLWAAAQTVPVLGIGDYNFDYDFPTEKGNPAYDEFVSDHTWQWVKPAELIDTNWADRDEDGVDDYPHSCLDFTFVAGAAKRWQPVSRVIVRDGDFPDDETTSDHRPVELVVVPTAP